MLILPILFFYIVIGNNRGYLNDAYTGVKIQAAAIHGAFYYFFFTGNLDQHTMFVLIQGSFLVFGAQFIHFLKYRRPSEHRQFFIWNTVAVVFEFIFSLAGWNFGQRNLNLCPVLSEALHVRSKSRLGFSILLLVLSTIFSILDIVVARIDAHRNKDVNRRQGEHSISTLPRRLLWENTAFTLRRIVYHTLGVLFYCFTIYNIEYQTVRGLHKYLASIPGVTSHENTWSWGQAVAVVPAVLILIRAFSTYITKEITPPFAKRHACTLPS